MSRVRIYTTRWCGFCARAKALLDAKGVAYEELSLDGDHAFRAKLLELTGQWTVPQILVDDRPIGGYTELVRLERDGGLDRMLGSGAA
jgi:glutaredoxin 3